VDIYLIRHAEAVDPEQAADMSDFDRPLTETGRAQAQQLAKALPVRGANIQRLFVSPLVRTRQTAEPLIAAWGLAGDAVVECEELAPGGRRRKLAKRLNQQPASVVGLVGHRPDLNEFAGWLIGDKDVQIALDKGGVALIRTEVDEVEKGAGELIWLLPERWV
jgi:phosphohistidine phosphatase